MKTNKKISCKFSKSLLYISLFVKFAENIRLAGIFILEDEDDLLC